MSHHADEAAVRAWLDATLGRERPVRLRGRAAAPSTTPPPEAAPPPSAQPGAEGDPDTLDPEAR
jgi:hypothetical protein